MRWREWVLDNLVVLIGVGASVLWVGASALTGSLSVVDLIVVAIIMVCCFVPARRTKRRAKDDGSLYGPPE